jgi:histone deacetylase complex regulatory component SIN3
VVLSNLRQRWREWRSRHRITAELWREIAQKNPATPARD